MNGAGQGRNRRSRTPGVPPLCLGPDGRPASAAVVARTLAAIDLPPWTKEQGAHWWQSIGARSAPAAAAV